MTKINYITIHGFKSFANKTHIPFDKDFNCILGPNGSGKSNIGDALCFVLGRISAKSMRAEKAANLIFNGGKSKKPHTSGTVEISFCNESKIFPIDEKEIVIGRTITKSGSSIYRINGKKRTRTEIIDTMSSARVNPNGYNIILQGDITRFVSMSSLERRRIIEQISDVSIYEDKKHKANNELSKVDEKLNNAHIILKERKTYLRELKKDRDQALKFKELKDQVNSNKATYLHLRISQLQKDQETHLEKHQKYQEKITKSQEKINTLKEQINKNKEQISKINNEIEQKGEKEQVRIHKVIEDLKINLAKERTRVSTLKDEIAKIKQRNDQFNLELKELEQKTINASSQSKELRSNIEKRKNEFQDINQKLTDFKKKHKIESSAQVDKDLENKDKEIDQKQEEVQTIRANQQELLREKDKLEYQIETIDQRILKVKEVEGEHKDQIKQLTQLKTNFKNATIKLNKCLDNDSSFASQTANARRNLVELEERFAKLNAKAMSIKATIAGNYAVKSILENKKQFNGVYGTVAQLGQVKKQYSQALQSAAGARMQNLVVDDDKTASDCIKYLKSNKLGSAAFIPLNKVRYSEVNSEHKKLLKQNGVHNFAIDLINFKPQFKKAFNYVFGTTLIVDDIDVARKVGIGKIKMATLDGNIAEASGVMKGGYKNTKNASGFQEQDSLEELERIEGQLSQAQGIISNIKSNRDENQLEIDSLRKLKAELEGEIIKLEKSLHLESGDLDATNSIKKELKNKLIEVDNELRQVQFKVSNINRELAGLKSKKAMLRSAANELRNPRLLAQLSAFEESKQKIKEDIVRFESDLKNSSSNVEQLIAPEKEKIKEIIKQHLKEEEEFKKEIESLSSNIEKSQKELEIKEAASKEFYSKYKELFNNREQLSSSNSKFDNEIETIRENSRTTERELNLMSLKNAEIKARMAGLEEEFVRYKEHAILKDKTVEECKKEIAKFEVMLGQMSAVNMKALEIYEEVEKQYNELVEKREGLLKEQTDVLTLMNEIETKKKDHFMKTFDHANENFQRIFVNLFSKGKAYLELENKDKPFEGGLAIKVKLTGNRFMDIKSLSGGEKTMTALSFIFAIQEYQPASFYILDEIDAALDKHNAQTLAKLIRDYVHKAQYIVISHNDAVISEADTLFGVSMKEGVSKVTSLKI
jgi:chromosome segregation protein